ncbi:SymE family type I addiction module toxin [Symbiopectobacterium purcellii]|uniref:SymE family type I addiction module toxin n=1 Tax=Symbiopectobacterium purcellii TaxID=2871826 RepID=UPI003F86BC95
MDTENKVGISAIVQNHTFPKPSAAASRDTTCKKGDTSIPAINLFGKWLREPGFDAGTGVTVRIAEGCIVLIPDSDEVQALIQQTQRTVKRMVSKTDRMWDCYFYDKSKKLSRKELKFFHWSL